MSDFNHVILQGRLTRDPELSYTPNQTSVAKFSLASNHRWQGKDGQDREEVLFIDCTAFGHMANRVHKYGVKGSEILVEGRFKLDTWTAQDGSKRSRHSIVVDHLFLDKAQSSPSGSPDQQPPNSGASGVSRQVPTGDVPRPVADEDIPF